MRQVAPDLGVSHQAPNVHFGTKRRFLAAVAEPGSRSGSVSRSAAATHAGVEAVISRTTPSPASGKAVIRTNAWKSAVMAASSSWVSGRSSPPAPGSGSSGVLGVRMAGTAHHSTAPML